MTADEYRSYLARQRERIGRIEREREQREAREAEPVVRDPDAWAAVAKAGRS